MDVWKILLDILLVILAVFGLSTLTVFMVIGLTNIYERWKNKNGRT